MLKDLSSLTTYIYSTCSSNQRHNTDTVTFELYYFYRRELFSCTHVDTFSYLFIRNITGKQIENCTKFLAVHDLVAIKDDVFAALW